MGQAVEQAVEQAVGQAVEGQQLPAEFVQHLLQEEGGGASTPGRGGRRASPSGGGRTG